MSCGLTEIAKLPQFDNDVLNLHDLQSTNDKSIMILFIFATCVS